MTEDSKEIDSDKNRQSDSRPAISKLAKKKGVSLWSAAIISFILLLGLGLLFYYFFKDWHLNDFEEVKKIISGPDIVKKEFSFKKQTQETPEEKPSALKLEHQPQGKITVTKPLFQKYKSIPIKSHSETSPTESAAKETPEKQETSEGAVVAERSSIDPNFLIPEGTYIPCSLTTKFTSDVTGRITCTISEDIYGANGLVKLIEKGTKAIGTYQGGNLKHGVGRMFVIWTKLVTPDFTSIKLVDSQVVGQLGESGIDGWIDSHFFERFGGAILLSTAKDMIKMTQEERRKDNKDTTVSVNTMNETKNAFVAIVEKMLENSMNIPPTMYKNQGDIIGILVGRDIDFSKVYTLRRHP